MGRPGEAFVRILQRFFGLLNIYQLCVKKNRKRSSRHSGDERTNILMPLSSFDVETTKKRGMANKLQ
jgi:hypothetical protein